MTRQRAIRTGAGLLAAGASAAGYAAATADDMMVGGAIAAVVFLVAGLAAVLVTVAAIVPGWSGKGRPVAASAGVLLALSAILLVPFTAARSLCACTTVPEELLPPAPAVAGMAPHDLLFGAAIAVPLLLLAAANLGRSRSSVTGPSADAVADLAGNPPRTSRGSADAG